MLARWVVGVAACLYASAPTAATATEPKPGLAGRCQDEPAKPAPPAKGKPAAAEAKAPEDSAYAAFDEGCYVKALRLAQEAAARNEPQAFTLIGQIHEQGLGVPADDAKAAEFYAKGAALGDSHAQFQIGMMLLKGRGVTQNRDKAIGFLELAAGKNHPLALYNIAQVHIEREDFVTGAQYLEKAAALENTRAQFDLGSLYASGLGVQQDHAKAAYWMGQAAKAGLVDAELEYGVTLINGRRVKQNGMEIDVVKKNEVIGLKYLEAAAEKGNAVAQNRVARAYRFGVGVDYDEVKSAKWHLIARDAGVADPLMDLYVAKLSEASRKRAEEAAQEWRDSRIPSY
jgi:hypothetical protein